MKNERCDIVIVGAGAVGCAAAYLLSQAGLQVTILEQDSIGSGSSAHATGLFTLLGSDFSDGPSFEMALASHSICKTMVPALEHETSIETLFQHKQAIRLALDEEDKDMIQSMGTWQSRYLPIRWLSATQCHQMEPRITKKVIGGMLESDALQIDSYKLTLALAKASEQNGATIKFRRATKIKHHKKKVTGIEVPDGEIECKSIILATGSWSNLFSDQIEYPIFVEPLKGERLILKMNGKPLPLFLGSPKGGHIITRKDGLWSIGSTGGRDDDDQSGKPSSPINYSPSDVARLDLLRRAVMVMPCLENAQVVQQLAGSRPATPDRKPLIGSIPNWEGLYLATGHTARGVHLSFITAKMIHDLILGSGNQQLFDYAAFSPTRFNASRELDYQEDPPIFEG